MRIQSPNWIQSIYHKCSIFLARPNLRCFYSSEEELLDITPRWTAIAKWAVNELTPPKEHEDAVIKLKKTLVIKEYLRRQTWSMPFCPVYWTGQYCEYLGMETSNTRHSKRSIWELDSSLVAQTVKHLPTMWEIWVRSLGQEEPLEKEMATHSSTFAWKIPWTEEPGRL